MIIQTARRLVAEVSKVGPIPCSGNNHAVEERLRLVTSTGSTLLILFLLPLLYGKKVSIEYFESLISSRVETHY